MKELIDKLGVWGTLSLFFLFVSGIFFWIHVWTASCDFANTINYLTLRERNQTTVEIFLFALLSIVTVLAGQEIRFCMSELTSKEERRASLIAIIIGLMFTIFIFWQPLLNMIFSQISANQVLKYLLFSGSAFIGWIIWWVRKVERYGDFFYVLLLTITAGFCWYARIKGTTDVEVTAYSFIMASLARIAFQYLDKHYRKAAN